MSPRSRSGGPAPPVAHDASAIAAQARTAARSAYVSILRSRLLVQARRLMRDPAWLITRCAWCSRFDVGGLWVEVDELPRFMTGDLRARATHSICPSCVRQLERNGSSRLARGDGAG